MIVYEKHAVAIKSLPAEMSVKRIRFGDADKVAVIGGGMEKRVIPATEKLAAEAPAGAKVEFYKQQQSVTKLDVKLIEANRSWNGKIPPSEIPNSPGFRDNMSWRDQKIAENYTFFDIGPRIDDLGNSVDSVYLRGEYTGVFGE